MLIITRNQQESIRVGHNIKIKILQVEKYKIHIGIDAPDDVNIVRKELLKNKYIKKK